LDEIGDLGQTKNDILDNIFLLSLLMGFKCKLKLIQLPISSKTNNPDKSAYRTCHLVHIHFLKCCLDNLEVEDIFVFQMSIELYLLQHHRPYSQSQVPSYSQSQIHSTVNMTTADSNQTHTAATIIQSVTSTTLQSSHKYHPTVSHKYHPTVSHKYHPTVTVTSTIIQSVTDTLHCKHDNSRFQPQTHTAASLQMSVITMQPSHS